MAALSGKARVGIAGLGALCAAGMVAIATNSPWVGGDVNIGTDTTVVIESPDDTKPVVPREASFGNRPENTADLDLFGPYIRPELDAKFKCTSE